MTESPFRNETVVVPKRETSEVELELYLELDATVARGLYSNVVLISHSLEEFTLEFAFMQPSHRALVQSRVILSAARARELAHALIAQLARRSERFPALAAPP